MLTLLSPAKRLDFEGPCPALPATDPGFMTDTRKLVKRARELAPEQLSELMSISAELASLNHERFRKFKLTLRDKAAARPAAFAFRGDVYLGLDVDSLGEPELDFAQGHLRILSGLYGVLRPLDRIQPYRLEMGTKLATERGKDLYAFWGDRLAKALKKDLAGHDAPVVCNLASNEYFKAVKKKTLGARVVTPVFQEVKDGTPKVISFMAKKARGKMTRWILENRVDEPGGLKDFRVADYRFVKKDSSEDRLVFRRKFRSEAVGA